MIVASMFGALLNIIVFWHVTILLSSLVVEKKYIGLVIIDFLQLFQNAGVPNYCLSKCPRPRLFFKKKSMAVVSDYY